VKSLNSLAKNVEGAFKRRIDRNSGRLLFSGTKPGCARLQTQDAPPLWRGCSKTHSKFVLEQACVVSAIGRLRMAALVSIQVFLAARLLLSPTSGTEHSRTWRESLEYMGSGDRASFHAVAFASRPIYFRGSNQQLLCTVKRHLIHRHFDQTPGRKLLQSPHTAG